MTFLAQASSLWGSSWFFDLHDPGSAVWEDFHCPLFFLATPEVDLGEHGLLEALNLL